MFFASSSRSSKNQQQQCVCERVGGLRSEEKESGRGAVKTGRLLERREDLYVFLAIAKSGYGE